MAFVAQMLFTPDAAVLPVIYNRALSIPKRNPEARDTNNLKKIR